MTQAVLELFSDSVGSLYRENSAYPTRRTVWTLVLWQWMWEYLGKDTFSYNSQASHE